jgi:hypothetical protein
MMSSSDDLEVPLAATASPEHDRLATIDQLTQEIDEWKSALMQALAESQVTDQAYAKRAQETVVRLLQMDDGLHRADFDPEWLAEFRGLLLDSVRATQTQDPLDAFDKLLLDVEAMRHLLRDALDGHVAGSEDDVAAVVEQMQQWLPRVSQAELADLMGVSKRQYQRWAHMHAPPSRRAQIAARLIAILRRSWTDAGVVAWFYRKRPNLEGHAPIDVIDDPRYEQAMFREVRQGRAEHGS